MAAFTSRDHPIILDCAFLSSTSNATTTMFSPWLDEEAFSSYVPFYTTDALTDISVAETTHESSSFDKNHTNEAAMIEKQKQEISSTLLARLLAGEESIVPDLPEIKVEISGSCPPHSSNDSTQASKKPSVMEKQTDKTPKFIRIKRDRSCLSSVQGQEEEDKKQKKCNCSSIDAEGKKSKPEMKQEVAFDEPPRGYVHVRARRGEATDSHSLAERVRREKISERMKVLQSLVPGCQKVGGKAAMLDEIINYVQSLQNQLAILSIKVASLNALSESEILTGFTSPMPTTQGDINNQATVVAIPPNTGTEAFPSTDNYYLPDNQATVVAIPPNTGTETFPSTDNYYLPDNPTSVLICSQQGSNAFFQDGGNLAWDAREGRERSLINLPSYSNNTSTFH